MNQMRGYTSLSRFHFGVGEVYLLVSEKAVALTLGSHHHYVNDTYLFIAGQIRVHARRPFLHTV